jgi:hypothetical protein
MATAKSKSASKSHKADRTAPVEEPETVARARHDRIAAESRVGEKASDATTQTDTTKGAHDAHPESATDTSVRHAEPQTGKQSGEGEGGHPAGEYDITQMDRSSGQKNTKGADTVLSQHFAGLEDKDNPLVQATKEAQSNSQIPKSKLALAIEALPVGALIEHEAPNRWRAHVTGQLRYGHGATFLEAVESYILGTGVGSMEEAAARTYAALPSHMQEQIDERDRKAAARVGGTVPEQMARDEAKRAAAADASADLPARNANTDGPEKASARAEQGDQDRAKDAKK